MTDTDFLLTRAVLELRYRPAHRLWDRAGDLADKIEKLSPALKNTTAQPNQIVFVGDKIQASIELHQIRVVGKRLRTSAQVEEYAAAALTIVQTVVETIKIEEFQRAGCRLIFAQEHKTREAAEATIWARHLLSVPQPITSHLKASEKLARPELSFAVEDKDSIGMRYHLRIEEQTVEFQPAFDVDLVDLEPYSRTVCVVVFDFDRYTMTPIPIAKLSASEWILSAHKAALRDRPRLVGGE